MARPEGCNYGDPNSYTNYTGGIAKIEPSDDVTFTSLNVVKTIMNTVQFCGDVTLPENAEYPFRIGTVPETMIPTNTVQLVGVCQTDDDSWQMCRITIDTDGVIQIGEEFIIHPKPFYIKTVFLDSCSYDLASSVYGAYNGT